MKKARKALLTLCAALLLVSMTVGATVAYLTSTDAVTNTFTVGNVAITLDEAKVNLDGTYVSDVNNRVKANTYKLMPGHTYIKDPIVHVDAQSENCWLFVKVEDEIVALQDAATIKSQMNTNGWTEIADQTNVYAYQSIVAGGSNTKVFDNFKILGTVDNATLAGYAGKTVKITAYAVQADGFTTAAAAWNATFGAPAGN